MPLNLQKPILYLITSGNTTAKTTPQSKEFHQLLIQIEAAVAAGIDLVQIREKELSEKTLFDLAKQAAVATKSSATRLLVNERADIAIAAGADGVHLTSHSIPVDVVRRTFGVELLIGASTHSRAEVTKAQKGGADFVVLGPIFETESKKQFGPPLGLRELEAATSLHSAFPVIAIGGINPRNAGNCFAAKASGVAGIGMFDDSGNLSSVVADLRQVFHG